MIPSRFIPRGVVRSRLEVGRLPRTSIRFQSTDFPPPDFKPRQKLHIPIGHVVIFVGWVGAIYLMIDNDKMKSELSAYAELAISNEVKKVPTLVDYKIKVSDFTFGHAMTPEEVTKTLNARAFMCFPRASCGVKTYHGAQLPSNVPCEDAITHGRIPHPWANPVISEAHWLAWGVFDGHLGAQTSQTLARHLVPYVYRSLEEHKPADAALAIKRAFAKLDDVFVKSAAHTLADPRLGFAEQVARLAQATNGSCALLGLFDPSTRTLRVACTGDSRAVLGTASPPGTGTPAQWTATALSADQTGSSEAEIARIAAAHPGEDGVTAAGRVLGLMCSRAFGDAHWKWPAAQSAEAKARFAADRYRPLAAPFVTPPYITAEPEVVSAKIARETRAFAIFASDGLWDLMSSEQAVELVGAWVRWADDGKPAKKKKRPGPGFGAWDLSHVEKEGDWPRYTPENLTVQDDNVAVHLIRNALGGAHHERVSGIMGFKPPYSRDVRDDITVQVVFFD